MCSFLFFGKFSFYGILVFIFSIYSLQISILRYWAQCDPALRANAFDHLRKGANMHVRELGSTILAAAGSSPVIASSGSSPDVDDSSPRAIQRAPATERVANLSALKMYAYLLAEFLNCYENDLFGVRAPDGTRSKVCLKYQYFIHELDLSVCLWFDKLP